MLTTKLIVRVLDRKDRLLGWTEIAAEARGDGQLWAKGQGLVGIEAEGTPEWLSVHWADVNVEERHQFHYDKVAVGEVLTLQWPHAIFTVGLMPSSLPPVTVRAPITVAMPAGALGAVAN